MSAPPRAGFVAGCQQCGSQMEADSLEDVAWFYACHREAGHDVDWLWGTEMTLTVETRVTGDGEVANLTALIGTLEDIFRPTDVPAELLYETCLNAGAEKAAVEAQLERLPDNITDCIAPLE